MALIPSIEELKILYKDVMSNQAVKSLSEWIESNSDDEVNEEEYLKKAKDSIPIFSKKMNEVLNLI